jgi:hypothetical protein
VADRVGPADRVGLAEQVVGEADVPVRIGAGQLLEGGPGARAHGGLVAAEQLREVRVALPALEQQLEHRLLVGAQRHTQSLGIGAHRRRRRACRAAGMFVR